MTHPEKVAHLCRRLAFGSTIEERQKFERMSIAAITDELLDFSTPNNFPIHPFESLWNAKGELQNQPQRIGAWWALRMAFGNRPAHDKLLVFLHDHFAVSGAKVESGVLMLGYLQALEANLNAPFASILRAMTADPAMMSWLDLTSNVRGRPNENYAREVLELFTLGAPGSYTEADIQELARAFTGWSIRSAIDGGSQEARKRQLLENVRQGWPLVSGSFAEGMHDPGPYNFLGASRKLNTDSICDLLAGSRYTASNLSRKLLEYYLYPDPEQKLVNHFADVFLAAKGNLVTVVRAIVTSKEFWSEKAQRAIIKSPVDYLIPIIRQLVPAKQALEGRDPNAKIDTPLPQPVLNLGVTLYTLMGRMGMSLLYPPDVAGWKWGGGWISTSSMIDRVKLADVFTNQARGRSASAKLNEIAAARGLKSDDQLVDAIFEIFDASPDAVARQGLSEWSTKNALPLKIGNLDSTSAALRPMLRALFAIPAFQMM